MKKNLMPYYLSRAVLTLIIAAFLIFTGTPLLTAGVIAVILLLLFLAAPLSGRYSVHPEKGITALRRDEWTTAVNDKAARNAFVATMLALGAASIYARIFAAGNLPIGGLEIILLLGIGVYYLSDYFLRRA